MATRQSKRQPGSLLGVGGIAARLKNAQGDPISPELLTKWLLRYPHDGTETPTPAPDFYVTPGRKGGKDAVWLDTPETIAKWEAWQASRPSPGRPGQPKPRAARTDAAA